jgi:hypothetical protein
MTASHINDPDHWRKRAGEMRALASEVKEADAKAVMTQLAADYGKLAARAAQRANGLSPKR